MKLIIISVGTNPRLAANIRPVGSELSTKIEQKKIVASKPSLATATLRYAYAGGVNYLL